MGKEHKPSRPVTPEEAHESLSRFIASHFGKSNRDHARFTIPVDFERDDDVRLSAFIDQYEEMRVVLHELFDSYVEENGGDMPTNDDHPAHAARRVLELPA